MQFRGGDRPEQQGMALLNPPWAGGKHGFSRRGGTSQGLSLTTAHHHTLAGAGPQRVAPRPAGDRPINLCFPFRAPINAAATAFLESLGNALKSEAQMRTSPSRVDSLQ